MSTDPADGRWARLKELYHEALERPEEARAAFLDAACADDPALREELAALLRVRPEAEAALDAWAAQIPPVRALADGPGVLPHLQVGPYRLVREVGRGGMGTVFLAERADGQYVQRVALKLIRSGGASAEAQRRFRAERQILARLAHPGIARLLDGGLTPPAPDAPDGLPYLVMEYVAGEELPAYCDARGLGLDARLALFLQVGDAVAYAHRNLVVHRDLKPSNVLVTEGEASEGEPAVKLLDFGIARLLDDEHADGTATETGAHALTPAYAAPEQIRGEAATTATDVYALGVLLYELLTGQRPFRLQGRSPAEAERVLASTVPPRPSTALTRAADAPALARVRADTPPRLARRLRGDLDTIVLKALATEPTRRYATVEAFADDLRRYRAHLPVRARPDTTAYRTARFVRRHRAGVAAGLLVAVAVLGGAGVALWQGRVARLEAQKAEAALQFIASALTTADPNSGDPETPIRAVLDTAAARLDADLAGQPLVAAGVNRTVGVAYLGLGLFDRAERHLARSVALYAAAGPRHRAEHADALLHLAVTLDSEGRTADAVGLYARTLAVARRARRPDL